MKDIVYSNKGLKLDLYLPSKVSDTIFIYFHGGYLKKGDKGFIEPYANIFTKNGIALASVNYRLYPEAKYPEYIEDAVDAIFYIKNNCPSIKNVYVGGTSAGAYIAMMIAFNNAFLAAKSISNAYISGYIFDAGDPYIHISIKEELESKNIPLDEKTYAPISYVNFGNSKQRFLIINADHDLENRAQSLAELVRKMRIVRYENIATHTYRNATHCSYVTKNAYYTRLVRFINNTIS